MAKIVLVCPFCQKKVETDDSNVGRDGQCPACEKIFEISAPAGLTAARPASAAGSGWLAGADEYEYQDINALVAAAAVGIALLLLVGSTFTGWAPPHSRLADYVPAVQAVVLAASVLCCAFFAFSAVGGKSLMPAVIVSGAWGTLVAIWTWAIWFFADRVAANLAETSKREFSLSAGLFFSLAAGLLVTGAAVFAYRQVRASSTFKRLGFFMVVAELVAIVLAFLIVAGGVRPAVAERAKSLQQPAAAEQEAPPGRPSRTQRPPAPRERPAQPPEPGGPPGTRPGARRETGEVPAGRPETRPDEPPSDPGAVPFVPADEEEDF